MIECYINGQQVYPSLSSGLKIVIENPAMREKSSYTYDIVFPLDIAQNASFFLHVGFKSVSVKTREYENCRLVANNKVLFSGKGIVTGVTESNVKMQIVQEVISTVPSVFSETYIDKIAYPPVASRYKQAVFDDGGDLFWNDDHGMTDYFNPNTELQGGFIGERYKYTFVTTIPDGEDLETGEAVENLVNVICITPDGTPEALYRLAVQPSLIYVLKQVLESKGYSYDLSSIDTEPWKSLYIASARKSLDIADALPHWTAEKFLQEIEKLFNISFRWDANSVTAVKLWEQAASQQVQVEAEDEFERNYDEDGQEYDDTSNLTYQLSDTHDGTETISREAISKFSVRTYASENEMRTAVANMAEKERKTSFFATTDAPELYYWHESDGEDDADRLTKAGLFRPLFRDLTADNEKELNIIPVALETDSIDFWASIKQIRGRWYLMGGLSSELQRPIVALREVIEDYVSVQDMVEDGSSADEKTDDSVMEVMFVGPLGVLQDHIVAVNGDQGFWLSLNAAYNNKFPWSQGQSPVSLSLNGCTSMTCIGDLHVSQLRIDGSSGINKNEETIVKFLSDDIPPIGNIFLISNKRYVAKQLEVQITETEQSKEITGHFYGIL